MWNSEEEKNTAYESHLLDTRRVYVLKEWIYFAETFHYMNKIYSNASQYSILGESEDK